MPVFAALPGRRRVSGSQLPHERAPPPLVGSPSALVGISNSFARVLPIRDSANVAAYLASIFRADELRCALCASRALRPSDTGARLVFAGIDACLEPNKTSLEVQDLWRLDTMGPLRNFSGTCRKQSPLRDSLLR